MEIKNARYVISNANVDKCPAHQEPEYAFIGRSNVGKSSLINMLTGNKNLAKTSQKPGKTLLINHFSINGGQWYIVDLPGYGYAARGKEQRQQFSHLIKSYILGRKQLTCLFVLLDVRHKPQKIDLDFISWLGEHGVPFAIIFTKADKVSRMVATDNVEFYRKTLLEHWEELPPIFVTSSEKKRGREELLDFIEQTNRSLCEAPEEETEEKSEEKREEN